VHTSLDLYAFVAVAPSISTLEDLIAMVQAAKRQELLDKGGLSPKRSLDVCRISPLMAKCTDPLHIIVLPC
jgi:hypothetical protein